MLRVSMLRVSALAAWTLRVSVLRVLILAALTREAGLQVSDRSRSCVP